MKNIKVIYKLIYYSVALCLALLVIRILTSDNLQHTFLLWNLVLALIPLVLSLKFSEHKGRKLWVLTILWLLFLPNSFYVVTDLIHLNPPQVSTENLYGPAIDYSNTQTFTILFDAIFLFTYALVSFVYGLESIRLFRQKFSKHSVLSSVYFLILLTFVSSFAIYLGRFSRWNSWDMLVRPWLVVKDSLNLFIHPADYSKEWLIIISFTIITFGIYRLYELFFRYANTESKKGH